MKKILFDTLKLNIKKLKCSGLLSLFKNKFLSLDINVKIFLDINVKIVPDLLFFRKSFK